MEDILLGRVGIIGLSDTIFAALGFREGYQLAVITFILIVVILIIYFDNRIGKLEVRMKETRETPLSKNENQKIYNFKNDSKKMTGMNKKGLSQLAWLLIAILIVLLLYFLFKKPF
ncbi:MAG TPA: hypothetical protein VJJ21_04520 [Candidatus Nanoarchaeia archaeon]|nr:hypothetical protein [Candidatus Nanoarchaeia archaeon]